MAPLIAPFSGFIPSSDYAPRIVGPPSSMLTPTQKAASRDDELSFRGQVGRGARAPYAQAMRWLDRCQRLGALHALEACVIVHRLTRGDFSSTGLLADVSLDAYDAGLVKRHEATIAKTQRKMLDYMQSTRIFGNPVALAHRDQPDLTSALDLHTQRAPDTAFVAIDGAHHALWVVTGDQALRICDSFDAALYITDGHHRLAAAAALATVEGTLRPQLPAALFAESQLKLGAYSRVIDDEQLTGSQVLLSLRDEFELVESDQEVPRPSGPRQIGVRVDGRSFMLTIPEALVPADIYRRLDVNLLQDLVLQPVFGVTDPRTDPRLSFVADTDNDSHDVDAATAWFLPYPTSIPDVMAVADADLTMPPKSTYFLPKVPSGLLFRPVASTPDA